MTLPVVPPIVGVLRPPCLLGVPLIGFVGRILGKLVLLPPALAFLLTGTLGTVLVVLHFPTRLKKPPTGPAATPFHDTLPGTLRFLSVAQFNASVKKPGTDCKVSGGSITGASF